MRINTDAKGRSDGFTLVELLISMVIVAVVMGATLTALTNAYRATESAKAIIGLNNNLRIGVDLVVRDLIQVGQGMPTGRTVQVPSGAGAARIQRPHPQGSACTEWPEGITAIPAVTEGPGCGPTIDGVATDMVTTLAVDSVLDAVPVWSFNVGAHSATVSLPAQAIGGLDISAGGPDDVRVGDLMMFTKGSGSALVYVTSVSGGQAFTFAPGDPMNLNQFTAALNGTLDDLATTVPTTANSSNVSRIRMITYYLDNTLDATTPRLIRHMNWGDPNAAVNARGRTVAFAIENLQITYDMVDGVGNPSNVRMVAADLTTAGACAPRPCSPNQIRKVNVFVAGRSMERFSATRRFFRNTLSTQVSLRSLALVDRYK
jgi:prepilin-type N-terminal cleavage/methylation domain-containing protein